MSELDVDALRAAVARVGGEVRTLKAASPLDPAAVAAAVARLTSLRRDLDAATVAAVSAAGEDGACARGRPLHRSAPMSCRHAARQSSPRPLPTHPPASPLRSAANKWKVDKRALEDVVVRRMFVVPSFEIHGCVGGLYDLGPPGCALKEAVLALWRSHFILEDALLQIECTTLTPHAVLKTSGHVDKFEDLMVRDAVTGECHRADKLLEDWVEATLGGAAGAALPAARREELRLLGATAGSLKREALGAALEREGIKAPGTGNALTPPYEFNLMFQTTIGPSGAAVGFLRPETAQGMFVNFRRLYDFANGRMPMGVAQIGSAYRNEIAPRGGLLRVREFTMAEIEFFVNPDAKQHARFDAVAADVLTLFPAERQTGDGKTVAMTLRDAVAAGTINNETLGYYMARTAAFLLRVGIKPAGLRFRQHLRTEMAHYACDCWDAEILMSTGWIECVGIADRSAYDLTVSRAGRGAARCGASDCKGAAA